MRAVARKRKNEEIWISWLAAHVWQAVSLLSLHLEWEDFLNFDNFWQFLTIFVNFWQFLTILTILAILTMFPCSRWTRGQNIFWGDGMGWVLIFRSGKKLSECQNIVVCDEMLCLGVTSCDQFWNWQDWQDFEGFIETLIPGKWIGRWWQDTTFLRIH